MFKKASGSRLVMQSLIRMILLRLIKSIETMMGKNSGKFGFKEADFVD
jgi:hypothetical protein